MCDLYSLFIKSILLRKMGNSKSTKRDQVLSYYFPNNYRMNEVNDCFEIHNLKSVIYQINEIKKEMLIKSTCTDNSIIIVDDSKRMSFTSKKLINIDVLSIVFNNEKNNSKTNDFITINPNFEYIEYKQGGFFAEHTDKDKPNANATVLIYPPQTIEGGELCLNLGGYKVIETINPHSDKWLVVVFPNLMAHESKIVKSGLKIVLKGTAYINYDNQKYKYYSNSFVGLED